MAVLSEGDRLAVWAELQRTEDNPGGVIKIDLRSSIDATDDWVDANAAAFNSALPQPARAVLTARQKARLLAFVVDRRWRVS